ncbi:uncharacterized protein SPAPADRAFT_65790 [Spathaspora passalidarum NRRL Y-27907]|uniref:Mitochondrial group I intron splicing factor CCM1 n=1 Tax=Spathaspora passalidarum (strain NRRL Y-27907 / 11-Y1) TaxID=619300 RepID=G3AM41_SPAPN|nr:uncharacterized protein SPAPADRAFT_65790 [Spathaspora passalidarum NRRL Y-27907]EGW32746.1 hypothetical protein SPAPADRAFT_65790 [Spathaspora passalidarum NRRL Y-27907]
MIRLSLLRQGSIPARYLTRVRGISTSSIATATSLPPGSVNKPNRDSNQGFKDNKFNNKKYNKNHRYKHNSNDTGAFNANPHRQRDGKHAKPIPTSEELHQINKSKIQTKLQYFLETGEIVRRSQRVLNRMAKINTKYRNTKSDGYDLKKGLRTLKERYDTAEFIDKEGNPFPISSLNEYDLKYNSSKARTIFDNLVNIKKITKSRIDQNLMLCLLGTNSEQLKDEFFITKNMLELLTVDNDMERALYLVQIADKSCAAVGMNVLTKWVLDKGKVEQGLRMFSKRSKFGVPTNKHTLVILFDGIAKASEWGQVNNKLADRVIEIFKSSREKSGGTIEEFNACLSVLIKNFDDQQSKAWTFFTNLLPDEENNLREILPNDITFTIMINGLKRFMNHNKELIRAVPEMNRYERALKLMENEANAVQMVDAAFEKIKTLAIQNPGRINLGIQLIVSYLSCYIDKFGSPYRYNEKALYMASQYSTSVNEIFEYVQRAAEIEDVTRVTKSFMKKRDSDIEKLLKQAPQDIKFSHYESPLDFLPKAVVPDLKPENVNPIVNMPIKVPTKKGKFETIYRDRPLVDFAREKDSNKTGTIKLPINKFLLNLVFDGLMNIGRFNEFMFALWYSLIKWNGVKLDLDEIANKHDALKGVIPSDKLPRYSEKELVTEANSSPVVQDVYDDITLKNILLRISTNRGKGETYTHLIVELFNVLSSSKHNPNGIVPSYDHVKLIFFIFREDLKYYKAANINEDKTRGFHFEQLREFNTNLYNFTQGYMLLNQRKQRATHPTIVDELNEIYATIYSNNWNTLTPEQELLIHKLIIKSGILFLPKHSIKISESVGRTMNLLKEKTDISTQDKKLLGKIKDLVKVRKDKNGENVQELEKLTRAVYYAVVIDPVGTVSTVEAMADENAEIIELNSQQQPTNDATEISSSENVVAKPDNTEAEVLSHSNEKSHDSLTTDATDVPKVVV